MAKSYTQLQADIAALQKKAEDVRHKEAAVAIKQIKDAIAHYGITAEDLGLGASAPRKAASSKPGKSPKTRYAASTSPASAPPASTPPPSTVKFRDAAGHTWSGRGPKPGWFKEALAQGFTPDALKA